MLQINYFNPVVDNWTPECMEREINERRDADYNLYVITNEMTGFYSIAEIVEDSILNSHKTVVCFLLNGFTEHQIKSVNAIKRMCEKHGATFCGDLESTAEYLNSTHISTQ